MQRSANNFSISWLVLNLGMTTNFQQIFFKRTCGEKIILLYVNYKKGVEYGVIIPTSQVLDKIKSLNAVMNGTLFEITVLRRQLKGEIREILDNVVQKCYRPSAVASAVSLATL